MLRGAPGDDLGPFPFVVRVAEPERIAKRPRPVDPDGMADDLGPGDVRVVGAGVGRHVVPGQGPRPAVRVTTRSKGAFPQQVDKKRRSGFSLLPFAATRRTTNPGLVPER